MVLTRGTKRSSRSEDLFLKWGKAAGPDGIEPEHLLYAHPIVQSLLTLLFNSIVHYGYVPQKFGGGIINI